MDSRRQSDTSTGIAHCHSVPFLVVFTVQTFADEVEHAVHVRLLVLYVVLDVRARLEAQFRHVHSQFSPVLREVLHVLQL